MKKQLLLILLVCNIAYGQTKKETIDWLNSKFENSPIVINETEQYTRFLKISSDGNFKIQSYNYSPRVLLPDSKNYRRKVLVSGNFKDLSPNSVNIKRIDGKIFFFASCSSGKCITMTNQGPEKYNTYTSSEVLLSITNDKNLETRCKKAFIHLINLYGGQKEPF